jgi:putative transcriptional regulator
MGQELISGLEEVLAHERGAKKLRTTTFEIAEPAKAWRKEQIAALRKNLFGVSQPLFASLLSVTVSTVRAWEQGQKSPSGAARRLLEIAAMAPDLFMSRSKNAFVGNSAFPPWITHSQAADRPISVKTRNKR